MIRTIGLAAAIAALLAGCATTRPPEPSRWLVGTWLMMGPDVEHPLACASGLPIRYDAAGRLHLFEESGIWRLEGDRLTETVTQINEPAEGDTAEIGRPYLSRIERLGSDEFRKTYADGAVETFRRCPT